MRVSDVLILLWSLFVCIVYVGGYLAPAAIGYYTSNLSALYAVALIGGICAAVLRWRIGSAVAEAPQAVADQEE